MIMNVKIRKLFTKTFNYSIIFFQFVCLGWFNRFMKISNVFQWHLALQSYWWMLSNRNRHISSYRHSTLRKNITNLCLIYLGNMGVEEEVLEIQRKLLKIKSSSDSVCISFFTCIFSVLVSTRTETKNRAFIIRYMLKICVFLFLGPSIGSIENA